MDLGTDSAAVVSTPAVTPADVDMQPAAPPSKKSLKRQAKQVRLKQRYESMKQAKRQKRAAKQKTDPATERQTAVSERPAAVSDDASASEGKGEAKVRWRDTRRQQIYSADAIRLVLDSSFDELMNEKEIRSYSQQIRACYGATMKCVKPARLIATSCKPTGKTYQALARNTGMGNWLMEIKEESFTELFPKEQLVYLSSEGTDTLLALDPSKVYVIGGLVDHNRFKGLTHRQATERGIATVKLPIGEYLQGDSRKVLTVNQVVELLLEFAACNDWTQALLKVLPRRKGFQPIEKSVSGDSGDAMATDLNQSAQPDSSSSLVDSSVISSSIASTAAAVTGDLAEASNTGTS